MCLKRFRNIKVQKTVSRKVKRKKNSPGSEPNSFRGTKIDKTWKETNSYSISFFDVSYSISFFDVSCFLYVLIQKNCQKSKKKQKVSSIFKLQMILCTGCLIHQSHKLLIK